MTAEFLKMFAALQEQTKASFWRSDVLRPLHILFLAVASILAVATYAKAPEPLLYGIGALLGLVALTEVGGFVYCLLRDPDLLRSERIRMQKMAIEARLLGDQTSGLFEAKDLTIESIPAEQGQITMQGATGVASGFGEALGVGAKSKSKLVAKRSSTRRPE